MWAIRPQLPSLRFHRCRAQPRIAVPAVFAIGADLRIRYRSVDSTRQRVHTDGVLSYLIDDTGAGSIKREPVRAGIRDFARATMNAIRRGLRTPHE